MQKAGLIYPEGESPLQASWNLALVYNNCLTFGSGIHESASLLVSRKVAKGDLWTEGSGTTNVGTDEQELHKRLIWEGKAAHHANAYKQ